MGLFWGLGDSRSVSGTLKSPVNKTFDWRHNLRFCEHAYATPKFHNFTVAACIWSHVRYQICLLWMEINTLPLATRGSSFKLLNRREIKWVKHFSCVFFFVEVPLFPVDDNEDYKEFISSTISSFRWSMLSLRYRKLHAKVYCQYELTWFTDIAPFVSAQSTVVLLFWLIAKMSDTSSLTI